MLTSLHVASIILLKLQAPARCLGLIAAAEEITLICMSHEYLSDLLVQEPIWWHLLAPIPDIGL